MIERNPKFTHAQWAATRYCSRQCASKRLIKVKLCKCGCGAELKGRRYIPGHRPKRLYNGYVRIWAPGHPMAHSGGTVLEHRKVAYDAGWDIPEGHHVHHKNGIRHDNRLENLEVVEIAEHARIHARAKTPTHCPKNHEYTPENTGINQGWRYCKQCNRDRARARREQVPA